ncbi:sensor histidine kinase [Nocardioides limicola]|uniref:sensor histidine kinase n=1 Tax=Nocardioides limicola TaxID=2803368 RepID=UPI00193AE322|nr:HAMP domain-containing sensor histidine kinase [Nocardioides sp. DJM-14]
MRSRLALILFVPSLLLLILLGVAYTITVARVNQQHVFVDRLRDASYLAIVARQSLRADDPTVVAGDLDRYLQVYGIEAAVLDTSGEIWASNGLDVGGVAARSVALSGRRGELDPAVLPWQLNRIVIAEPVFDGGDLVGAVVTASDVEHLSRGIWRDWILMITLGVMLVLAAFTVADRTATWVLRPVRRVDRAMSQIGRGQLKARIPESVGPPELRGVTTQFNEMAERVEHLMRKQREFVHNASHELRNPLTALTLRVEELELTAPADRLQEVTAVRAEVVRLRHILDALLLLADDVSVAIDAKPVQIADLVADRVESWRHLAPDRALELGLPAPASTPAVVNSTAVECALDAVLDNALKFSPVDRPVQVTVGSVGGRVEIAVRDHGPGVPVDELESVTERFWRSPSQRTVRGSGLGLAIASELMHACGGGLALDLPEGGGLRVVLTVPREGR